MSIVGCTMFRTLARANYFNIFSPVILITNPFSSLAFLLLAACTSCYFACSANLYLLVTCSYKQLLQRVRQEEEGASGY